jgi:hypothetical protein
MRWPVRCWQPRAGALLAALATAGAWGCSAATPPISLHNLERPTDMVISCIGLFDLPGGGTQVSGRPMNHCHVPNRFDDPPDLTRRTFGFVTNTARGELSVIDLDASKLIDLDPANPDTNVAPLGVLPEQIAASDDGCRMVSANRGSCDLTVVDVGALVTPELQTEAKLSVPQGPRSGVSQQVVVSTATRGRLRVAPQEVLFLPQDTTGLTDQQYPCAAGPIADPIGWPATLPPAGQQKQWKALVTFPTCNLVALVDLPSGNIIDSVQVNPSADGKSVSVVPSGADPVCPTEDFCDGRDDPQSGMAAATADAGAAFTVGEPFVNPTGTRPSSLAIRPGGERAYVGLAQAAFVVALDLVPGGLAVPSTGDTIQLHEGALGVQRVRLSVDPFKATGIPGQYGGFVGEGPNRDRQYLYVMARDGTVRVIDVSRSTRKLPEIECDANIDPQHGDPNTSCYPADPPAFASRRPFAQGPGLRMPGGAIPIDVAAVDLITDDPRSDYEGVLDGAYAFVLTSNGTIYIVNIAPTLRVKTLANVVTGGAAVAAVPPESPPLVNSLRDRNQLTFISGQDLSLGAPRLDLIPTVPALGPQILGIDSSSPLDNVYKAIDTTNAPDAGVATFAFFPQRTAVQRQTWSVTWEGDLFGISFGGQFKRLTNDPPQPSLQVTDSGVSFCLAGVLPGDFVTLFGCTADSQCGPSQVCKRSDNAPDTVGTLAINGLCMPLDATLQAAQIAACTPLLESVRRYEIVDAKATTSDANSSTYLTLRPRIDEIVSESLNTCIKDGVPVAPGSPCAVASDPTRRDFTCERIGTDAQLRCVETCGSTVKDHPCRAGRTCVQLDALESQSYCADAPSPFDPKLAGCNAFDQLTGYRVGVGNGFLVQGTAATPYIPGRVSATLSCAQDPQRLDRIPYFQTTDSGRTRLPFCSPNAYVEQIDKQAPDINGTFLRLMTNDPPAATIPAPCLFQTRKSSADGGTEGAVADAGADAGVAPYYALFQNRELRFVLAHLENYIDDSDVISFDVHGGFQADSVLTPSTVAVDTPARLLLSPIDSQGQAPDLSATQEIPFLFVVDQRRLARAGAGVSATRGQILRIYSRKVTTTDLNSLLPVYDDLISSVNLWPIQ